MKVALGLRRPWRSLRLHNSRHSKVHTKRLAKPAACFNVNSGGGDKQPDSKKSRPDRDQLYQQLAEKMAKAFTAVRKQKKVSVRDQLARQLKDVAKSLPLYVLCS